MIKMLASTTLAMVATSHAAPPPPMPKGCFASPPGTTYKWGAGNLFPTKPDHGGNYGPTMDSPAKCCALCQSFKNCTYFTYSAGGTAAKPICYNEPGGCCFLNTAAAAAGKQLSCPTCTAGLTKPPVKPQFPVPDPFSPAPILYLPLGDSITWGCGTDAAPRGGAGCVKDAGGYRVPLIWALSQAGYNVTTMGTLKTGPSYVPEAWISHEGHPGWVRMLCCSCCSCCSR